MGKLGFIALNLVLVLMAAGHAANAAAVTPLEWIELLSQVKVKGEQTAYDELGYVSYHIKRGTSFQLTEERDIEYLTLAGQRDDRGQFVARNVVQVQESWRGQDQSWEVTQKVLMITLDGEIASITHQKLRFQDGVLQSSENLAHGGPKSPEENSAWQESLSRWIDQAKTMVDQAAEWKMLELEL